jgi:hypothetical protein
MRYISMAGEVSWHTITTRAAVKMADTRSRRKKDGGLYNLITGTHATEYHTTFASYYVSSVLHSHICLKLNIVANINSRKREVNTATPSKNQPPPRKIRTKQQEPHIPQHWKHQIRFIIHTWRTSGISLVSTLQGRQRVCLSIYCKNNQLRTLTAITDMIATHEHTSRTYHTYRCPSVTHHIGYLYIPLRSKQQSTRHAKPTRATRLKTWPLPAVTTLEKLLGSLRKHSCRWRHERQTCFTTLWYNSKGGHVFFSASA